MLRRFPLRNGTALAIAAACLLAAAPAGLVRFEAAPRAVIAAAGEHDTRAPKVAFTTNGLVYLLAAAEQGGGAHLELRVSKDGGDTFGAPTVVTPPEVRVADTGEQTPQFFIDPARNRFAVLYQGSSGPTKDLYVTTKSLFGTAPFGEPVRVTDSPATAPKGFASLALAPNGDYAVAWLDGRRDTKRGAHDMKMSSGATMTGSTFDVAFARSTDGGATFGPNVAIAPEACPCCRPSIAFGPDRTVYVAWRKVYPGDFRDIVVATSHDDGATWSAPVRVNADGWSIRGCPDSGPSLATDEHGLAVAWFTLGRDGAPHIRAARSRDGATFGPSTIVSAHVEDANHVSFVPNAPVPTMVFEGRDPRGAGWGRAQAYVVRSTGTGWSAPMPAPGGTLGMQEPAGAMRDASTIFVTGTAASAAKADVVLIRGRM
jgi:hypothetical protein